MKISLFVPWLVKGGADRCGLDMIAALREEYPDASIDTVITRSNAQGNPWGKKFEKFSEIVDLSGGFFDSDSSQRIIDYLAKWQPDKIIINNSHEAYNCVPAIRACCPYAQISCLLHMHLPGAWDFPRTVRSSHLCFDRIFTVSSKLAQSLYEDGVPQSKIVPLHWFGYKDAPEPAPVSDVRKALGITDPNAQIILFPFRLSPQKRPFMIPKIMGYLRKRMNCVGVVAGCGNLESAVKDACEYAGIHVRFLGAVEPEEMHHLYAASFCAVTPSEDEGIPLTYYECFQTGCPVVASDVGAVSELVTNGTGVLVPYEKDDNEQAKSFSGAVLGLHNRQALRQEMRVAAHKRASVFSYDRWRMKFIQIMKENPTPFTFGVKPHRAPINNKVFVIGCPRTGTSSVGIALQKLGFRDYEWNPLIQDYYHMNNLNPIWEQVGQFDSFSDGPFNTGDFYEKLFWKYPTAKFILTTRNKEDWKKSFERHFSPDAVNPYVEARYRLHRYIGEDWWNWYDQRNAAIINFFEKHNAKHRLLQLKIGQDKPEQLWSKLSDFLGVREPAVTKEFPHVNKYTDKKLP